MLKVLISINLSHNFKIIGMSPFRVGNRFHKLPEKWRILVFHSKKSGLLSLFDPPLSSQLICAQV